MTAELQQILCHKCHLFKLAVRSGSLIDWEKYKEVRNLCTAKFRKAKSSYFAQQRQKLKSEIEGSYRWWHLIKDIGRISAEKAHVPVLENDGLTASSDQEKAGLLGLFFAAQCSKPDGHTRRPLSSSEQAPDI